MEGGSADWDSILKILLDLKKEQGLFGRLWQSMTNYWWLSLLGMNFSWWHTLGEKSSGWTGLTISHPKSCRNVGRGEKGWMWYHSKPRTSLPYKKCTQKKQSIIIRLPGRQGVAKRFLWRWQLVNGDAWQWMGPRQRPWGWELATSPQGWSRSWQFQGPRGWLRCSIWRSRLAEGWPSPRQQTSRNDWDHRQDHCGLCRPTQRRRIYEPCGIK